MTTGLEDRFWQKVTKGWPDGCWLWSAASDRGGYGMISRGARGDGMLRAHRVSWELHNGPIPEGLDVLHHCDTRLCVNPSHLFLGTDAINMADASRKGRMGLPRGEQHGHAKLSESEVFAIRQHLATGSTTQQLAARYGVSRKAVWNIKTGRSWGWLETPL